LLVEGNDTQWGYQLLSPPVEVRRHGTISLHVAYSVERGRACVGVLDARERTWLVTPNQLSSDYQFESGDNERVRVVIANCNAALSGQRSRFVVSSAAYAAGDEGLYVDMLMGGRR
jgi:hypothetical protein